MPLGRMLVFLVLAVGGLVMAGYGWTTYQNQHADVDQSITVEGTVESTGVADETINNPTNPSAGHYEVVVRHTYTYEGQSYTSESVYPGAEKEIGTEAEAREIAAQYAPGQSVTVYVNQATPSRSYLIAEQTQFGSILPMALGGLIAVLMLLATGKEIGRAVRDG
jgi:hypothetical protein